MAKASMKAREKKRIKMVLRYAERRDKLKKLIKNPMTPEEERIEAQIKLQKLPRDANPIRIRNRCNLTGRSRGYYRRFGLSRISFRELALSGKIPGIKKASW